MYTTENRRTSKDEAKGERRTVELTATLQKNGQQQSLVLEPSSKLPLKNQKLAAKSKQF